MDFAAISSSFSVHPEIRDSRMKLSALSPAQAGSQFRGLYGVNDVLWYYSFAVQSVWKAADFNSRGLL
jgi:hypothetical protein